MFFAHLTSHHSPVSPFPPFWSPSSLRQSFLLLCHVSYTYMYRFRFYDRICAIILISPLLYILMCVCVHMHVCLCARGGWGLKLAVFFISFSTLPVETRSLTEPESLIWLGWLGNVLPVSLSLIT